jgi:hypothetical protein
MRMVSETHLGRGDGPDLEVIRSHEQVGNTRSHHADDPLIKVLWLVAGNAGLEGSVNHAINALDLLLLWQHGDVVLEGIGNPLLLATDVGDALMRVPVVILGKGLVDAVIEVFVVGEDNVAANVVELQTKTKPVREGTTRL